MKIFAIVVTYNGMKWYDKCFLSLFQSTMPIDVVVVDNASTDGTREYIRHHFPQIALIESKENLGFAKANNMGIKYALSHQADYFFLLNQDAWIETDTIPSLVSTFDMVESIGIASPIHLNGVGSGLDFRFAQYMPWQFVSDMFVSQLKPTYICNFVNAAAWMISRKCIETVGGFNTDIFIHRGEDVNYCHRIQYHGFKLVVNTQCCIYHDRQERIDNPNNEADSAFKKENRDLGLRIRYCNPCQPINVAPIIRNNKRRIFLQLFQLKFKKIKEIKQQNKFIQETSASRERSESKGLLWLE